MVYCVSIRNVCHYAPDDDSVMQVRFWRGTGRVYAHALNWKKQYLTLLYVYNPAASSSTLYTVIVICITSFRVVTVDVQAATVIYNNARRTLQ